MGVAEALFHKFNTLIRRWRPAGVFTFTKFETAGKMPAPPERSSYTLVKSL
jgi:hypothetical protein